MIAGEIDGDLLDPVQHPAAVHLDVPNTGVASFMVAYERSGPGGALHFPFISSPIESLQVTGSASVKRFVYDDPFVGDNAAAVTDRMLGKRVVLMFGTDAKGTRNRTIHGVLKQSDTNSITA